MNQSGAQFKELTIHIVVLCVAVFASILAPLNVAFASVIAESDLSAGMDLQTIDSTWAGSGRPVQINVFDSATPALQAPTTTITRVILFLDLSKTNNNVGDTITINLSGTLFSHVVAGSEKYATDTATQITFTGSKAVDNTSNVYIDFSAAYFGGTSTALYGCAYADCYGGAPLTTGASSLEKSSGGFAGWFGLGDAHFVICDAGTCNPSTSYIETLVNCALTDLGCQISRAFTFAFMAHKETVDEFYALTFASTTPFGYLYEMDDVLDDIINSTSSELTFDVDVDTTYDGIDALYPLLGAVGTVNRATTTSVRIFGVCAANRTPLGTVYATYIMPILTGGLWLSWLWLMWLLANRIFNKHET